MKVAFYVYPTAFQSPGGGEIQLLKTKEYLEKEGLDVKLFDTWTDRLNSFDILHTFGSVKDALPMIRAAKTAGLRTVLSTICWYSWKSAWGANVGFKERGLSMVRHMTKSFFPWVLSQRKKMMELSDLLIPNSASEAEQITRYFGVSRDKVAVVPNGVDPQFAEARADTFVKEYGLRDFILTVGRIEPRKNQLQMIRALRGIDIPYVLVGDFVPQYKDYYDKCRRAAGDHTHFLGGIPHDSALLASAYAACNTFLLASWLETPGLSALEAGLAGAKIVLTKEGATREYFSDLADYAAPDNGGEIRKMTLAAFQKPKEGQLQQHILKHYLWPGVAKQTLEQYHRLLSNGRITERTQQDLSKTAV